MIRVHPQFEDTHPATKPRWRRRTEKFFDESTCNGALYILASKSGPKRLFWAVIIAISIGGFATITGLNISTLIREPTSTSISLTRETELDFPAVTLCSLSLLNVTTLASGGPNVISDLINLFFDSRFITGIEDCKVTANRLANDTGANVSWSELTLIAQNDLRVLLQHCIYSGESCSPRDFVPINTVAGLCYTFNKPLGNQSVRKVRGTGVRQGLQLQLSPDDQLFSLQNDHGFRVVIHNPDELPRPESDGIAVALESSVYIGMRQVESIDRTMFSKGHQCRNNITDQKLSFPNYNTSYSPTLCQTECFYAYVIERCGCLDREFYEPVSSRFSDLRNCSLPDVCCNIQAFDEVEESCDCPPQCNMIERSLTISSSTNFLGLVAVNVYYESLIRETRETTDSYTPWSLISDIGGNTGLFLGFTLLSGVEFLLLLVGLMRDCCCPKREQRS